MSGPASELFNVGEGVMLHVLREGAGAPILVPTGCGVEFYRRTLPRRLLDLFELVYVEMRGTGRSTGSAAGVTYPVLADDLNSVRAQLGLERALVMGHSNHGGIALEIARRHPDRTAAAVTVASVPDFTRTRSVGEARWAAEATAPQKEAIARRQAELLALDGARVDPDELAVRQYLSLTPLAWRDAEIDAWPLWGGAPRGFARYMQSILVQPSSICDFVPSLGSITSPVLAICGRYDYLCPVEIWSEVIGKLPKGTLEIFEESAHNPQYEEPDRFEATLTSFLRGVEGA